ncbi:MAG: pirin family protein [Pirellula sp.]|jgi:redox-sensitive bicupin YhaK (pirin superfamily)
MITIRRAKDRVAAGKGFGTHGHADMEIVSYVLNGELEHADSMGNGKVLRPGEFQRITAGTGITHSEFNPSSDSATHFYQIWILPERKGLEPSYEQKAFSPEGRKNRLQLVASQSGDEGSLMIHQDAKIYLADLSDGQRTQHTIPEGRHMWVQVLRGEVLVNGELLRMSDAAAISDEGQLTLQSESSAELMLFDLA